MMEAKKMLENQSGAKGLLVRAEPLEWAEEICQKIVHVERTTDGALPESALCKCVVMLLATSANL